VGWQSQATQAAQPGACRQHCICRWRVRIQPDEGVQAAQPRQLARRAVNPSMESRAR
jgi:hypothetical protein